MKSERRVLLWEEYQNEIYSTMEHYQVYQQQVYRMVVSHTLLNLSCCTTKSSGLARKEQPKEELNSKDCCEKLLPARMWKKPENAENTSILSLLSSVQFRKWLLSGCFTVLRVSGTPRTSPCTHTYLFKYERSPNSLRLIQTTSLIQLFHRKATAIPYRTINALFVAGVYTSFHSNRRDNDTLFFVLRLWQSRCSGWKVFSSVATGRSREVERKRARTTNTLPLALRCCRFRRNNKRQYAASAQLAGQHWHPPAVESKRSLLAPCKRRGDLQRLRSACESFICSITARTASPKAGIAADRLALCSL